MSFTNLQEAVSETAASIAVPQKALNVEEATTIATDFLKRIGHKGDLKPKRVSLEEELYTVEIETKKLMAVVKVDLSTHEIKEYDVQPKSEESFFSSNFKSLLTSIIISVGSAGGLYFFFKMLGI